jgi:hypothetical protein
MRFHRVLILLLILGCGSVLRAGPQWQKGPVRESEIQATIQAIEDEIYDLNLQLEYFDLRGAKDSGDAATLNVYFQPEVLDDSRSWVIYKLMPGGEVLRMYEIGQSGCIYLHMRPGEFRITQPSYPTVYMDDDELCKLKHDWIKRQFVVNLHPSKELVEAARARQRDRKQHTNGPAGEPPESGR